MLVFLLKVLEEKCLLAVCCSVLGILVDMSVAEGAEELVAGLLLGPRFEPEVALYTVYAAVTMYAFCSSWAGHGVVVGSVRATTRTVVIDNYYSLRFITYCRLQYYLYFIT